MGQIRYEISHRSPKIMLGFYNPAFLHLQTAIVNITCKGKTSLNFIQNKGIEEMISSINPEKAWVLLLFN